MNIHSDSTSATGARTAAVQAGDSPRELHTGFSRSGLRALSDPGNERADQLVLISLPDIQVFGDV